MQQLWNMWPLRCCEIFSAQKYKECHAINSVKIKHESLSTPDKRGAIFIYGVFVTFRSDISVNKLLRSQFLTVIDKQNNSLVQF